MYPPAIILDCEMRSQEGIIQPLGRMGVRIVALSSHVDCPAFHSRYVNKTILSPSLSNNEEDFIAFLCQLPEKGVLFYSDDISAVAISRYQQRLKDAGYLLNIAANADLETAFDKWHCYQLAQSIGIPMAKTQVVTSPDDIVSVWQAFEKPVMLKGTRLAGGNYPLLSSKDQISAAWQTLQTAINSEGFKARQSGIILQEWHSYEITDNWSCEALYTKEGVPVDFFPIKRIRTSVNRNGTFSSRLYAGHYEHNQQLIETTELILTKLNWKGFAHVEYFYVPKLKRFLLTEINPRLPGYSYYPGSSGFNLAYYYYADLTGIQLTRPAPFPKSIYFEAFLYPGDITAAFNHVAMGRLNLLSFLTSYLQIFRPGTITILEPLRLDDPGFSVHVIMANLRSFLNNVRNFLSKWLRK